MNHLEKGGEGASAQMMNTLVFFFKHRLLYYQRWSYSGRS